MLDCVVVEPHRWLRGVASFLSRCVLLFSVLPGIAFAAMDVLVSFLILSPCSLAFSLAVLLKRYLSPPKVCRAIVLKKTFKLFNLSLRSFQFFLHKRKHFYVD